MPNYQAQQYAALIRSNPLVKKFLDLIAWAEGADYNVGYGGRRINDLSAHPYPPCSFKRSGEANTQGCVTGTETSAAGRYQFVRGTWDEAARALGLTDFSPQSQDVAALYLIDKKRGALPDVMQGNVTSAVLKLRREWESFAVRPMQSIVEKFNGQVTTANSTPRGVAMPIGAETYVQDSFTRFNQYLGLGKITPNQRYMVAFAILILIFIFAFS